MAEPKNVVEMFLEQVRRRGDASALRYKKDGRWIGISWNEWAAEVTRLARSLLKLGLRPHEAVTLACQNRHEWVTIDLATQMAGAMLVPIYPTLTGPEARYIAANCEARIAIVENATQLAKLLDDPAATPKLEKIIVIDGAATDPRVLSYEQFRRVGEGVDDAALTERYSQIGPHDIATLVYTSGTTGQPKGAMLTHDNILYVSEAVLKIFEIGPGDQVLSLLPLSHVYERAGVFYPSMRAGIEICFAESIEKLAANLVEIRPTILCGVPRVLEKVYAGINEKTAKGSPITKAIFRWALGVGRKTAPYRLEKKPLPAALAVQHRIAKALVYDKISARFGGRVRLLAVAGAPMSREISEFFFHLNILTLEGYGMTECCAPATLNTLQHNRFGTVGRALPGLQIKIADDGEILLRGRSVFAGYFHLPEATAETLIDGWLHTGDIGEFDPDGMLRITDRKKDLIVTSGGKNVAPQKIENMLIVDQYIAQAVVIGDERNFLTALIVPAVETLAQYAKEKGFALPDRAALGACQPVVELIRARVNEVNQRLAKFETIKDFRLLDHDLTQETGELTPTLKVKRKVVREKFADLIDQMYAEAKASRAKEGEA
jgi:long-chain acyl-CoA synthetase